MRVVLAVTWLAVTSVLSGAQAWSEEGATAAPALDGKALFRSKCGMCHLAGGTGTFMLGRRLGQGNALLEARTDLAPEYIRRVVRNGMLGMPRITRAELSNSELQAVVGYLSHIEPANHQE